MNRYLVVQHYVFDWWIIWMKLWKVMHLNEMCWKSMCNLGVLFSKCLSWHKYPNGIWTPNTHEQTLFVSYLSERAVIYLRSDTLGTNKTFYFSLFFFIFTSHIPSIPLTFLVSVSLVSLTKWPIHVVKVFFWIFKVVDWSFFFLGMTFMW